MTNGNNDVRELEDLLTELEGQGALPVGHYSEEDDAVTQLMDAPLGEQEWMIQITPHDRRMMSTDQILGELATGSLVRPDMLVWRSGMGDWAPISTLDDLRVGRPVMDALPERRPLPAPPLPPTPLPPRINANGINGNGLGSSALASPSPIGRAPLPPPPSVPFVPQPPPPALDLAPPAPLPVFGAGAPSTGPELNPFSPPTSLGAPIGSSSRGSAPGSIPAPPPATARVNTHGPVAVDFSEMEPPRSGVTRVLVGSAIAAMLMIGGTVYALSAGGVFEAKPQVSSEGAPGASAAAASAAPAMAALPKPAEPKPAEPKPEAPAEAPAAAGSTEPQTQPASVKEEPAVAEAPKSAAADEGDKASAEQKNEEAAADDTAQSAPSSSKARKAARRNRREKSEEKTASAERAKPEPRRAPERRSKARAAAAAPEVGKTEETEEAPKAAEQPGSTFNKQAAKSALDDAAAQARNCRPAGGPSGPGRVQVRYEPNGKVGAVTLLTPSFENTTTGDCVVMVFRRAAIPAFTGTPAVVMNKNFEIP
jgi:uncharacterized protein DUF4339